MITADCIAMLAASVLAGSLIGKVLADWVLTGRGRP
jgi:hypothetical protein